MYTSKSMPDPRPVTTQPGIRPGPGHSPAPRRKQPGQGGEHLAGKQRWSGSGYKKVLPTIVTSKLGQVQTRIPKLPRGKENNKGTGGAAKVVKPVIVPNKQTSCKDKTTLTSSSESTTSTSKLPVETIPVEAGSKSPIFISSRAVPDLHNKILAKIRLRKQKSRVAKSLTLQRSPVEDLEKREKTMPIPSEKEQFLDERDSAVSGQDLEAYLSSMFFMVDTYRTGLVRSSSLLEYLGSLVDLPRLDKWKLEELHRLLDPDKDNRYVDQALWSKVGQAWIEMMLDPGNHVDTSTGNTDEGGSNSSEDVGRQPEQDSSGNVSYGSVEGFGGDSGCFSREVELENRVSELSYQLTRLGEDKLELEKLLAGSEEIAQNLASELEGSQKAAANMAISLHREEVEKKEAEDVKIIQEKCCFLTKTVENLSNQLQEKENKLKSMEVAMVTLKDDNEESKIREELMNKKLVEKFNKCATMEVEMKDNKSQIKSERNARENAESKLEVTQLKLQKLERDLSVKEEEIRNMTINSRLESVEGGGSYSMVHDVSVDDRVLMEQNMDFQHTGEDSPAKIIRARGPSASSTPQKGKKGSIADELKEMEANSDLPSPFCEKKGKGTGLKKEMMQIVDLMAESLRKIIFNQVKSGQSGRVMVLFNREIKNVKNELGSKLSLLSNPEEMNELRERAFDLTEKLNEAKAEVAKLESIVAESDANNIPNEVVKQVESKVEALASMLQLTNCALLGATESVEMPPDYSLEPDTDLSSWQLDLEGIQLVDSKFHLGKRLAQYTRCGKNSSLAELSSRSPIALAEQKMAPVADSLLWQSLCKRLEELELATSVSRDLLVLAGESMREQSVTQPSMMIFPKTVSCQTSPLPSRTRASQAGGPQTVSRALQTSLSSHKLHSSPFSTCLVEDCFCPSSQARSSTRICYKLLTTISYLLLLLLAFTFLCGLEIEHNLYYPLPWYTIRQVLGEWVPAPLTLVSFNTVHSFANTF